MLATRIWLSISRFSVDSFVPRSFRHFAYSMVESIHHSPANICWRARVFTKMNRVPKDWRHVLAILALGITILTYKFGVFSRSWCSLISVCNIVCRTSLGRNKSLKMLQFTNFLGC